MKKSRITSCLLIIFMVAMAFTACKKSSENEQNGTLDITQYYIAGKISGNQPYILTFRENARSFWIYLGGNSNQYYSYSFTNGILDIDLRNNQKFTFRIKDKQIVSYEGVNVLASYSLEKIPETNQFAGNVFSGGWKKEGSTTQLFSKLKFNAEQYGEASLGDPVINKDYTLINNISATSKTDNNGTLSFFVFIKGKLEAGRLTGDAFSSGTFTR